MATTHSLNQSINPPTNQSSINQTLTAPNQSINQITLSRRAFVDAVRVLVEIVLVSSAARVGEAFAHAVLRVVIVLGDVAVAVAALARLQAVREVGLHGGSGGVDGPLRLRPGQVAVAAMLALLLIVEFVVVAAAAGVDELLAAARLVVKIEARKVFLAVAFRFLHCADVYGSQNNKKRSLGEAVFSKFDSIMEIS